MLDSEQLSHLPHYYCSALIYPYYISAAVWDYKASQRERERGKREHRERLGGGWWERDWGHHCWEAYTGGGMGFGTLCE